MTVFGVWALCTLTAWGTKQPPQVGRPEVSRWFMCTDCTGGELDGVVRLGDDAVRDLALAFDISSIERVLVSYRQRLAEEWRRQESYAKTNPEDGFDLSESEYVESYVANLTVSYQSRAASALGEIRTAGAITALNNARARVTDPRVRAEIDRALRAR